MEILGVLFAAIVVVVICEDMGDLRKFCLRVSAKVEAINTRINKEEK